MWRSSFDISRWLLRSKSFLNSSLRAEYDMWGSRTILLISIYIKFYMIWKNTCVQTISSKVIHQTCNSSCWAWDAHLSSFFWVLVQWFPGESEVCLECHFEVHKILHALWRALVILLLTFEWWHFKMILTSSLPTQ